MARALLVLASVLALGARLYAVEEAIPADAKERSPVVQQYYRDAWDFYSKGNYRRAIMKWDLILKAEPDQRTASKMIVEARKQLEILTAKRRQRTEALIAAGRYQKALLELQALLDQDPGDPELEALQSRLEQVIKIAPAIALSGKAARMQVLGLRGYLGLPPELKLAHDALRYACELDPASQTSRALLDLLLNAHPELAEDEVTPGMKLLEYKHAVALHQIYDAKYHLAVLTLNEILALEPDDLMALKQQGSAYYSLGRKREARAAWTRALRLAPNDATLKKFLAKVGGATSS